MSQVQKIVAVFDVVSETVDNVHVVPTLACAIRSITDLSRVAPDHNFVTHASDYRLLHLADIDLGTGLISAFEPRLVCSVSQCFKALDLTKSFCDDVRLDEESNYGFASDPATDQGAAVGD